MHLDLAKTRIKLLCSEYVTIGHEFFENGSPAKIFTIALNRCVREIQTLGRCACYWQKLLDKIMLGDPSKVVAGTSRHFPQVDGRC